MIACEVMFVAQRADGSQGSSVWLVQLVLHRLCSNEQMSHSSLGVYKHAGDMKCMHASERVKAAEGLSCYAYARY